MSCRSSLQKGRELARGLVNYSAQELAQIKGLRSSKIAQALGAAPYEEAVHRDNLVLTCENGGNGRDKGPEARDARQGARGE